MTILNQVTSNLSYKKLNVDVTITHYQLTPLANQTEQPIRIKYEISYTSKPTVLGKERVFKCSTSTLPIDLNDFFVWNKSFDDIFYDLEEMNQCAIDWEKVDENRLLIK